MNLYLALHPLEDGVAGALLRTVLGTTHRLRLCSGYGPVGPAAVLWDGRRLISALGARLSHDVTPSGPITILRDNWSTHADLRGTSDDRAGGSEALSSANLVSSLVNILFLDDCGLITGASIGFLRAYSAARVRSQVLDLANAIASCTLPLHVVEDDALDVVDLVAVCRGICWHSFRHGRLDEGMLRDEEATACLLVDEGLGELSIATLVGYLPFNSGSTAGLPPDDIVARRIHNHLVDFIDGVGGSGRLRPLRGGLVEASRMPGCPLGIHSVLGRD